MSEEPPVRRARHLMDPANPRQQATAADLARLERVQKWVMSALAVTTIVHLSVGLVIAALYVDEGRTDAAVGLCVLAAAFGVVAVVSGLAIHRKRLVSPWLAPGLLPGLVGLFLVLR
ncbi:MAG: hypothetical protein WKF79_12110 [Nocardioides sp.]